MPSFILRYKKQFIATASCVILFALVLIYYTNKSPSNNDEQALIQTIPSAIEQHTEQKEQLTSSEPQQTAPSSFTVDIKGAVAHPGVYKLEGDARIMDAVLLAGGYTKNASTKRINHAQKLQDEMVIYIPKKGEKIPKAFDFQGEQQATSSSTHSGAAQQTEILVNINTASETELQTLSGVGPAKAQSIIKHRETVGAFGTIEDLMKVSGFGEKTFEKLRTSIKVQ